MADSLASEMRVNRDGFLFFCKDMVELHSTGVSLISIFLKDSSSAR